MMKRAMSFALSLMLLGGGAMAEEPALEKKSIGNQMGFEMIEKLHKEGENIVFSPLSLGYALGMAAEGAEGETLSEILELMGAEDAGEIALQKIEGIVNANAAFKAPGIELDEDYIERLSKLYGAEWFDIDDEIVEKVNSWVKDHTLELIDQLITEKPDPDTGLILVNAVSMDQKWLSAFDPDDTFEETFHAADGDAELSFMHQKEWFDYVERDDVQWIRLPYENNDLEMWIALPEEGAMGELLNALADKGFSYFTDGTEMTHVDLSLPKVDASFEAALKAPLTELGLTTAFGDTADFSGISESTPLKISEILQKARIQIDEDGTKAAAATAVIMEAMAIPTEDDSIEMNVNRPFAFVIADSESDQVCFAGVIEQPVEIEK